MVEILPRLGIDEIHRKLLILTGETKMALHLNEYNIFYSKNELRNIKFCRSHHVLHSRRCIKLKTARNVFQNTASLIISSQLSPLICACKFAYVTAVCSQARSALFNLSDSSGGMREFPESVNERI